MRYSLREATAAVSEAGPSLALVPYQTQHGLFVWVGMLGSAAEWSGGRMLIATSTCHLHILSWRSFWCLPATGYCGGKNLWLSIRQTEAISIWFGIKSTSLMSILHELQTQNCLYYCSRWRAQYFSLLHKRGHAVSFFAMYNCLEVKYKGCVSELKCCLIVWGCLCRLPCLSESIVLFLCCSYTLRWKHTFCLLPPRPRLGMSLLFLPDYQLKPNGNWSSVGDIKRRVVGNPLPTPPRPPAPPGDWHTNCVWWWLCHASELLLHWFAVCHSCTQNEWQFNPTILLCLQWGPKLSTPLVTSDDLLQ